MISSKKGSTERADLEFKDACGECQVRGIIEFSRGVGIYCDCPYGKQKQYNHFRNVHDMFQHAGVPERLRGLTLETLQSQAGEGVIQSEAVQATQDLVSDDQDPCTAARGHGICILGANGIGKTGLMVVLAREAYRSGFIPLFIKYLDLVRSIQAEYGSRTSDSQQMISTAQRVSHLVLDDLGDPFKSGSSRSENYRVPKDRRDIIFQILSARHEKNRPTYITANYETLNEIAHQFSPRIAGRIKEMSTVVQLRGPNLRDSG